MPRRPNITPEQVEQMRELREKGKLSYTQIAEQIGVHKTAVYYWLNPKKQAKKKDYNVERNKDLRPLGPTKVVKQPPVLPSALPPPDTRSLTGRLLGDPIPGRSALDRKLKEKDFATDTTKTGDPFRPAATVNNEPSGSFRP